MTAIGHSNIQSIQERARGGKEANIGNRRIRWASNDTDVVYTNNEGFNDLGILASDFVLDAEVDEYVAEVGVVGVVVGVVKTAMRIPVEFTVSYPTPKAEALAYGIDDPTVTQPSPAVASTVDDSPAVATLTSFVPAATTGLTTPGTKIVVVVGSSTYGTKNNYTYVKSESGGTITVEPPLLELPADGAAVYKYTNLDYVQSSNELPTIIKMQYIKYNNQREEVDIVGFLFQPVRGVVQDNDGKSPQTVTIRGHVIAEEDSANDRYVLLRKRTI